MLDFRLAWRRLCSSPVFFLFAVLSISFAVAVPTALYAAISAMLWPPSHVPEPSSLVFVTLADSPTASRTYSAMSSRDYEALGQLTAGELAASAELYDVVELPGRAAPMRIEAVSENYFGVLRLAPTIGRAIAGIDHEHVVPVVVSYQIWGHDFAGARNVLGKPLKMGGRTFEVQGVAPKGFGGIRVAGAPETAIWIPLDVQARGVSSGSVSSPERTHVPVTVVGRVNEGQSLNALAAEVSAKAAVQRSAGAIRTTESTRWSIETLETVSQRTLGGATSVAYVALGLAGLLFIAASTNLANLTWARAVARRDEFQMKRALGASAFRIALGSLSESAILAALGAVGAYLLVHIVIALLTMDVPVSATHTLRVEPVLTAKAIAFAVAAALVAVVIFAVEPAVHLVGPRAGAPSGSGITSRSKTQNAFVRWQVGICACLVFVAAVCGKSVVNSSRHDSGIQLERLTLARIDLGVANDSPVAWEIGAEAILQGLGQQLGSYPAAVLTGMPFGVTDTPLAAMTTPEQPFRLHRTYPHTLVLGTVGDAFGTLGLQITRGRALTAADERTEKVMAVISEHGARTLLGTTEVVGREVLLQLWRTVNGRGKPIQTAVIVGVMRDTDVGRFYGRGKGALVVVPYRHAPQRHVVLAINRGEARVSHDDVQRAIKAARPSTTISQVSPAARALAPQYVLLRIAGAVVASLSLLTLLLTMAGLYGLQSQRVTLLVREIGVRAALGASPGQIRSIVLRDALAPVAQGIAMACVAGVLVYATVRAILPMAFPIVDAATFAAVSLTLLATTVIACLHPMNRAARVDPAEALRHL